MRSKLYIKYCCTFSFSHGVKIPGAVLSYFHTYVGSGHFWGLKILNFNILGGFQNIFGGMKILWIFLGSSQNWTIFESMSKFVKILVRFISYENR